MSIRRKRGFNSIGEKYGMLKVISEAPKRIQPSGQSPRRFICLCECGKITDVLALHLIRGRTVSCGCKNKTQGITKNDKVVFDKWRAMINRCKPNAIDSHRYFYRGIKVCDEWSKFKVFNEWALKNGCKRELHLDRIDNDKGYYPENCRFVETKINHNNRGDTLFVTYKGEKIAFMLLMQKKNIVNSNQRTIRDRIKRGWNADEAIDKPIKQGNYYHQRRLS
jgi:hypothetical protein